MTASEAAGGGEIRAQYDEFTVGGSTVGMISDPMNEHAWIQSSETVAIDP